jgi:hypothetical protein
MENEDKSKIIKLRDKVGTSKMTASQYLLWVYKEAKLEEEAKSLRKKLLNEKD